MTDGDYQSAVTPRNLEASTVAKTTSVGRPCVSWGGKQNHHSDPCWPTGGSAAQKLLHLKTGMANELQFYTVALFGLSVLLKDTRMDYEEAGFEPPTLPTEPLDSNVHVTKLLAAGCGRRLCVAAPPPWTLHHTPGQPCFCRVKEVKVWQPSLFGSTALK